MTKKRTSCFSAFGGLLSAVALAMSSNAFSTEVTKLSQLINDPRISDVRVSPGGDYVAYVTPVENTDVLIVANSSDLTPLFKAQLGADKYVGQISWANDERFLLWPAKAYGESKEKHLIGEVQAINYDGSDNIALWGYQNGERQGVLTLENRLKYDPATILVATTGTLTGDSRTFSQMDIYSGQISPIATPMTPTTTFKVKNKSQQLVKVDLDNSENTVITYKNAENEWQLLADSEQYDNAWMLDHKHIVLKVKNESNKLVQFNRFTAQYSSLDDSYLSAREKDQRNWGDFGPSDRTLEKESMPFKVQERKVRELRYGRWR